MSNTVFNRTGGGLLAVLAALFLAAPAVPAENDGTAYVRRNLVSDGTIPAEHTDANLINPWGITVTRSGLTWIAGNGTSASIVYDGQGNPLRSPPLLVDIPGGSPTGIVFNDGIEFGLPGSDDTIQPCTFLFATEAGIISGWNMQINPDNALVVVDNADTGAVYKGIAIAANGTRRFLYVTDFHGAKVDVFDGHFRPFPLPAGAFKDPALPAGFAPFGIQNINGSLYVSYARQAPGKTDSAAGTGLGFVNVFNADGRLLRRLVSRGYLNAPWGMALAPADFGEFSNHLLIANFGDGRINAYNLADGEFKGALRGADNRPMTIEGLWGITFGNGVMNQPTNALFFTAGPAGENQGLYGRIEQADSQSASNPRIVSLPPLPGQQLSRGADAGNVALQRLRAARISGGRNPFMNREQAPVIDTEDRGEQDETTDQDEDSGLQLHRHDGNLMLKTK